MSFIKAISYILPEKVLTNEDLVKEFPEWTVDKIASKIGVNKRHIVEDEETVIDLAFKAANSLFDENPNITKESIDFLILCTQSPDYFLPTSACILQEKLGLRTNIGAFDFNLGCSGYIYGLAIAKGLIEGKIAKNVLLLTAETYSKHIHQNDKSNRTIFGDGATATLISTDGWGEIGNFSLGTDGKGAENLIVKSGGMKFPEKIRDYHIDENGNPISSDYLFMNGAKIFTFTQKNVPIVVKETLQKNSINQDDINLFIFHQANSYMLEFLRNKIKIEKEKFFINMSEIGNTVSNSIPIALKDAIDNKLITISTIKKEKNNIFRILLAGFGVGYSWGGVILTIKH